MAHIICGVDVSAATLDARLGRGGVWQQFARTTDGIALLAQFCKTNQVRARAPTTASDIRIGA